MEPTPATPPAPPPAAPLPPPLPAPPIPAPAPAPPAAAPEYGAGGVLKSFDWVEIGFLILGAFALYRAIDYFRKQAKTEVQKQATVAELQDKTDRIEQKLSVIGKQVQQRKQQY